VGVGGGGGGAEGQKEGGGGRERPSERKPGRESAWYHEVRLAVLDSFVSPV
jgi:hypothetical protein